MAAEPISPLELRRQVLDELNKPGLANHLTRIRQEQFTRDVETRHPLVIYWEHLDNDPNFFGLKPLQGSVTLYWAPRRSNVIEQLEAAHLTHNIKRLEQIHERLVKDYRSRKVITVEEATERMLNCPSFFDFQYGRKTLAGNLWLANAECGSMIFPYNGGHLNPDDFTITEYLKRDAESPYDVLIVVSKPKLNKIEQAALDAVPAVHADLNLTAAPLCFALCALVTIAVFVTVNTAVTTCCAPVNDRLAQVSLPEATIERLRVSRSAKELLSMRREIFDEFGIM